MQTNVDHVFLPHLGWMRYEPGDAVARFLRQGWFEFDEQAFLWLYLRSGDTVIDCGAHAGLFSILAGHLVGSTGRIVSIEPSPSTAQLLRENIAEHNLTSISTLFQCAAGAAPGSISFVDEGTGKSAYNRLDPSATGHSVPVEPLHSLLARANCSRADFLKIDVEGAEFDVIAGAQPLIDQNALPLLMVEFTEANLQRVGHSTESLYRTIESAGYTLHRFDPSSGQLVPRLLDGPIWYENLFAVHGTEAIGSVNLRLRNACPEHRRIAWDIVQRGLAGAVARETDEAIKRNTELLAIHESSQKLLAASREESATLAQQLSQAAQQLSQAQADLAIARLAFDQVDDLKEKLQKTRAEADQSQARLQELCSSLFQRIPWSLRLRPKPPWVDQLFT